MQNRSRSIFIFSLLFGYIVLQFLWWEYLLVKQNGDIANEKQKIIELTSVSPEKLSEEIAGLHQRKKTKMYMIAGEGTVFLLLLLYGIFRIKKTYEAESQLVNQQKNFVLSVTHELKTPIAATKLQLQTLLKHKNLDAARQEKLLKNALSETNRLNRLIEEVLLASRAEKNDLLLNTEKINLSEMAESVVTNYFSEKIKSKELEITIEKNIHIVTDQLLFPSVLINLIDNAFKYSTNHPKVKLIITSRNNQIYVQVSDQGIGIPDADKQKIFEKFYRVGSEETRKTKGTGLGLYIVKKIVEANKGIIQVNNNQPEGTVFEIIF